MPYRPTLRTAAGTLALAISAGVALSGPPAGAAERGQEMSLSFEGASARSSSGNSALNVKVVTRNGGTVRTVSGHGGGSAVALPAFKASNPPQAMMTVTDTQGIDDLSPGTAMFRIGADFTLDRLSQGSSSDNGNNLLQRGLFGSSMQYKLQVDHNRPWCRIKGEGGAVSVRSTRQVPSDAWHRIICTRDGNNVKLQVIRMSDGARWSYQAWGRTGALKSSRSLPLSIGGKVNNQGAIIAGDSDQFNGRVDNAFLNIF